MCTKKLRCTGRQPDDDSQMMTARQRENQRMSMRIDLEVLNSIDPDREIVRGSERIIMVRL